MRTYSANPFRAQYDGKPILEALREVEGSPGEFIATKVWELELMTKLQMSEAEYAEIPLMERARKIVAMKLPDWVGILESERVHKELERKYARATR